MTSIAKRYQGVLPHLLRFGVGALLLCSSFLAQAEEAVPSESSEIAPVETVVEEPVTVVEEAIPESVMEEVTAEDIEESEPVVEETAEVQVDESVVSESAGDSTVTENAEAEQSESEASEETADSGEATAEEEEQVTDVAQEDELEENLSEATDDQTDDTPDVELVQTVIDGEFVEEELVVDGEVVTEPVVVTIVDDSVELEPELSPDPVEDSESDTSDDTEESSEPQSESDGDELNTLQPNTTLQMEMVVDESSQIVEEPNYILQPLPESMATWWVDKLAPSESEDFRIAVVGAYPILTIENPETPSVNDTSEDADDDEEEDDENDDENEEEDDDDDDDSEEEILRAAFMNPWDDKTFVPAGEDEESLELESLFPEHDVLPFDVCDDTDCPTDQVITALEHAYQEQVDAIVVSLEAPYCSYSLYSLLEALSADVQLLISGGSSGELTDYLSLHDADDFDFFDICPRTTTSDLCADSYQPYPTIYMRGDIVSYEGVNYEAQVNWLFNAMPGMSEDWWRTLGACTPENPPDDNPAECAETYEPYPAIYMRGDIVSYEQTNYESQVNWLFNVTPGTAEYWWKTLESCSSGGGGNDGGDDDDDDEPQDCAAAYEPYPMIYMRGDTVSYEGVNYESQSDWLHSVIPGTAEHWWRTLGSCGDGGGDDDDDDDGGGDDDYDEYCAFEYRPYPEVYMYGDIVSYEGVNYESQADTLYDVTPGTAEHWWRTLGTCRPDDRPIPQCAPLYQSYPQIYMRGDQVSYQGFNYESRSDELYNVTPGTGGHWWKILGPCDSSNPDVDGSFRITEYYLTIDDFTDTTYDLTLDYDLADNYFILVRGSRTGSGQSKPDSDYARVYRVPGGRGDLADSGASNVISLSRYKAKQDWEGVVTVVESLKDIHGSGFELLDIVETSITGAAETGTDTSSTPWGSIDQVVLFGGYRGGGAEFEAKAKNRREGHTVYTRLYPTGSDTLNWERVDTNVQPLKSMTMTTFVVEWGNEWNVQHRYLAGNRAGNGAYLPRHYQTTEIDPVSREQTWVWGTGTATGDGIGEDAEATLVTLGNGVDQNTTESLVAMGSEVGAWRDFDIYTMTHADLRTDYIFKPDGDKQALDLSVSTDPAPAGTRMAVTYNACETPSSTHPRCRFWSRYTGDDWITLSRGYKGKKFVAWAMGIDFSAIEPHIVEGLLLDIVDASGQSVATPRVLFTSVGFGFTEATSTGILGTEEERVRLTNIGPSSEWVVSVAPTSGAAALWWDGVDLMFDFNDPTGGGLLTVDPSVALVSRPDGGSTAGIELGVERFFEEGVTNEIVLYSSIGAEPYQTYDLLDVSLQQTVPPSQDEGIYTLELTLTAV